MVTRLATRCCANLASAASHIRGGDVACRYGGEEFLLIMPDASLEAAHQRAVLQQEAKKLRVQDAGQSLDGITLSLGVAIYPEHGRSIDSVLRAADAALYRAKQEGRDRGCNRRKRRLIDTHIFLFCATDL